MFGDVELTPERACIIRDVAVISDLHLGIENALQEMGIAIPRLQVKEIVKNVKKIINKYGIVELVIAGDLKHEFGKNLPYEREDVREFVEKVLEFGVKLEIVKGNHDNFLTSIISKFGLEIKDALEVQGFCIVHGHRDVECKKIVMGHEHPVVKVKIHGAVYSYPCYLFADSKILVLPAFSKLMPGCDVLSREFLSPILKKVKKIEIYAIEKDVLYLGTIDELLSALS
ncbi:MAG: metallophosphoesterase [Archaeoglobaceae archaeon]|nr:metallophosphoesterase [Archaeoglobaceae archaeon]MCX8151642.1 metallophosphoesterase [Archaeoglobaceae archaeon]MDW8013080.1 metallophosphoesterase [Archaeoglobaceae archaeon]